MKENNIQDFKKDVNILILTDGSVDLSSHYVLVARYINSNGEPMEIRSNIIRNDLPKKTKRQHALDFKRKAESIWHLI